MEAIYIWHPIKVNHALSELCGFNIYSQHGVFFAQFFFQNIIIETFEFDVQLTQLTFCPAIPRRPDICHEYHELYSWRKNCHVEKFQLSMYEYCGDFEIFSTCENISDVST